MSAKLCSLSLLLALTLHISLAAIGKHLVDKPSFLNPCDFNDNNLNTCFASNFQVLFREWKDGIPGLKSLGPLEPLSIKRLKINQSGALQINADIENLLVDGASGAKVVEATVDKSTLDVYAKLEIPQLHATGNYKVKGSVLGLNLNGQGTASFIAKNIVLSFNMKTRVRHEGDLVFSEILDLKAKIRNIGDFHIDVKNLFGGQHDIEDTANDLFNQNWRELYGTLAPTLEQTLELVLKDRFTKIYSFVPANFFITNLP
uniref:Protein takeout n=1 Tax=Bactrocera latifrons TaxID=174628 RepID=A0A0K8W0W5_BACLA